MEDGRKCAPKKKKKKRKRGLGRGWEDKGVGWDKGCRALAKRQDGYGCGYADLPRRG